GLIMLAEPQMGIGPFVPIPPFARLQPDRLRIVLRRLRELPLAYPAAPAQVPRLGQLWIGGQNRVTLGDRFVELPRVAPEGAHLDTERRNAGTRAEARRRFSTQVQDLLRAAALAQVPDQKRQGENRLLRGLRIRRLLLDPLEAQVD